MTAGKLVAVAMVVALGVVAALRTSHAPSGVPTEGRVAKVVDGDTLHVDAQSETWKIRLIGLDTPEAYPSDKLTRDAKRTGQDEQVIQELGRRASAFTRELCEGKSCRLEYDQANAARGHRDKYERLLAYVFVAGAEGEIFVNAEIIRQGYGKALTSYPMDADRKSAFLRLQREARAHRRGLWGEWKP